MPPQARAARAARPGAPLLKRFLVPGVSRVNRPDSVRYWVGGGGNWNSSSTANWAASSGGPSGASAPTASTKVVFDENSGLNAGGAVTLNNDSYCGGCSISGINTQSLFFQLYANVTWGTGAYTFSGFSETTPFLIQSIDVGTVRTITINGNHSGHQYVHFQDITIAGSAGALTGTLIGDCGGNSGITFTASAAQTWSGTVSGNWSTNAWTSRVPLPQDNVFISSAFTAGQVVNVDMRRLCRDLDCSLATGSVTIRNVVNDQVLYGSLIVGTGVGVLFDYGYNFTFAGRGTHTITSAGKAWAGSASTFIQAVGGSYTLTDDLDLGASRALNVNDGTFDTGTFNFSCVAFASNSGRTRSILATSGTWSIPFNGLGGWNVQTLTGLTFNMGSAVIDFTGTGGDKAFYSGGLTYGGLRYRSTGSGGLTITGNNTFGLLDLECTTARIITLPASGTQTVTGLLTLQGASGQLLSLVSSSPGTQTTVSATNGGASISFVSKSADVIIFNPTTVTLAAAAAVSSTTITLTAKTQIPLGASDAAASPTLTLTAQTTVALGASAAISSATIAVTAQTTVTLGSAAAVSDATCTVSIAGVTVPLNTSTATTDATLTLTAQTQIPLGSSAAVSTTTLAVTATTTVTLGSSVAVSTATLTSFSTPIIVLLGASAATASGTAAVGATTRIPLSTCTVTVFASAAVTAPPAPYEPILIPTLVLVDVSPT